MTKERKIEILMMDGCTKAEAEKFLKNNRCTIFTDFEERFESYMKEWGIAAEDIPKHRRMIEEKIPVTDWGVVETEEQTYYIMYVV